MQHTAQVLPSLSSLSTPVESIGGHLPVEILEKISETAAGESYHLDMLVKYMPPAHRGRDGDIVFSASLKNCRGETARMTEETWAWMLDAWSEAQGALFEKAPRGGDVFGTLHGNRSEMLIRAFTNDDVEKMKVCLDQANKKLGERGGHAAEDCFALLDLLDGETKKTCSSILRDKVQPWVDAFIRGYQKGVDKSRGAETCARMEKNVIFHSEPGSWDAAAMVESKCSGDGLGWVCNLKLEFTIVSVSEVEKNMKALRELEFRGPQDGTKEAYYLAMDLLRAALLSPFEHKDGDL